ncbi:AAA family ATPase [Candidatus Uhrbacteria bacterium]|nr:AAA family ATPase [Candidatus Uhrbacteria bacterium]
MAHVIAVVNQKGGVGKTTTTLSLGSYLAASGKFVCVVDMDPQANATAGLGVDHRTVEAGIYEAISGLTTARRAVQPTAHEGLQLIPATGALAGANIELVSVDRREFRLAEAILEIRNDFDVILIDCPPSLGLLTVNALAAADSVLIPVQAEYYALEGLGQLLETVELVRKQLRPSLQILGAVVTMYEGRLRLSNDVLQELHRYFPDRVFRSVIPRNVRLAEAPSHGKTIAAYDPDSKGARAYEKLAREMMPFL